MRESMLAAAVVPLTCRGKGADVKGEPQGRLRGELHMCACAQAGPQLPIRQEGPSQNLRSEGSPAVRSSLATAAARTYMCPCLEPSSNLQPASRRLRVPGLLKQVVVEVEEGRDQQAALGLGGVGGELQHLDQDGKECGGGM